MEQEVAGAPSGAIVEMQRVDWRRVGLYCLFAFAICGSAAIYIAFHGGLRALPRLQTKLVLALWYMPAPALAHLLTRWVTREGWHGLWLRPHLREGWIAWVVVWFLPAALVIGGAALFFLIFPQYFDPALGPVQALIDTATAAGAKLPFGKTALIVLQTLQALLLAPILNALPTLGEEFGWRAYLQPKLLPLGWRSALVLTGAIWGVWHWPIIAMGFNYGLKYAGAPWLGMVAFVWFTILFGIVLGWLTLCGKSVWPAVIGHGALNGIAALPSLFVRGEPNLLVGPLVFGLLAGIPTLLVAVWLWLHPPLQG